MYLCILGKGKMVDAKRREREDNSEFSYSQIISLRLSLPAKRGWEKKREREREQSK